MSRGWGKGSTSKWRRLRAACLDRDGHRCQLRLAGCQGTADQVHHTISAAITGVLAPPETLVSACRNCNLKVGEPKADPPHRTSTAW